MSNPPVFETTEIAEMQERPLNCHACYEQRTLMHAPHKTHASQHGTRTCVCFTTAQSNVFHFSFFCITCYTAIFQLQKMLYFDENNNCLPICTASIPSPSTQSKENWRRMPVCFWGGFDHHHLNALSRSNLSNEAVHAHIASCDPLPVPVVLGKLHLCTKDTE